MKTLKPSTWFRDNCFHIETPLGIVNIYLGLHDTENNRVESVEIRPDEGVLIDTGLGEPTEYLRVRLIKKEIK